MTTTITIIDKRIETTAHIDCPNCGSNDAIVTSVAHEHNGHPAESTLVTIECPICEYYEWYTLGKDI